MIFLDMVIVTKVGAQFIFLLNRKDALTLDSEARYCLHSIL